MERTELIQAEVEQARGAGRRRADEQREATLNEYSIKGLGRSTALLRALLRIDLEVVESALTARLDAEERYAVKGSAEELATATDTAASEIRSLVEAEMAWLEQRITSEAQRMGLVGALSDTIGRERERVMTVYERELRIRAGRRQRATESIPYFPDDLGIRFYETGRFHVLEAADVATDESIQDLCDLLYQYSEHDVYVFIGQNETEPATFADARENGLIAVAETKDYFYKHPKLQLDYVRILPGKAKWDWERELQSTGAEFRRLTLRLSERERIRRVIAEAARLPDMAASMRALWILESEPGDDGLVHQGSAFALAGVGVVTCNHVLAPKMRAFQTHDPGKRQFKVVARNADVDLAILEIEGDTPATLEAAEHDATNGDPVMVLGFPNYRLGDTGVVHTGRVSGRRTVSTIRRLLLSAPIIAGMSGGPVLDAHGKVIAIAVTGADRMDQTRETEDQSAIPIDTLRHLKKPKDRE